jgi:subfamily B ATP-binding cassette protein MsbA
LTFLGGLCRYFQEYLADSIGIRVALRLNREMFDNLVGLSHGFYERQSSGDIMSRFLTDAFSVNRGLVAVLVQLFREPIKVIFCIGLAMSVDPWISLLVIFVLSPILLVVSGVGRYVRVNVKRNLRRLGLLNSAVHEMIRGMTVIKAFGMEQSEGKRFQRVLHRVQKSLLRLSRANSAISPVSELILVSGVAFFLIISEQRVLSGDLATGDLVLLFGALAALFEPFRKLAKANNLIQTSIASASRVFEFIDMKPDVADRPGAVDIPPMRDVLRFENVYFSYTPGTDVLKGINFEIRQGEMVALVGLSGAGKTTVAKLIPRFYDVTGGRLTIDGTDIRDATLKSLRAQVGIVTQDTVLFNDTVRHNISFGHAEFSDDAIREAARKAHIDTFIESLPGGYGFTLSENGSNLSGGQRQRLAIARAILKDPAILILDEATSSLDSESEKAIQQAMDAFVVGRATVVIAHRLATIKRADRILVMEDGEVIEEGTHETLLARGGMYRRLYSLQFAEEESERPGAAQAR